MLELHLGSHSFEETTGATAKWTRSQIDEGALFEQINYVTGTDGVSRLRGITQRSITSKGSGIAHRSVKFSWIRFGVMFMSTSGEERGVLR